MARRSGDRAIPTFVPYVGIYQEPVSYTHLDVYKRQQRTIALLDDHIKELVAEQKRLAQQLEDLD